MLKNITIGKGMKHLIPMSIFALFIVGCGSGNEGNDQTKKDQVNVSDGLVAYYPFEGNARDSSGHENHGIAHGGIKYEKGVIGKAAKFDGVDDWIRIQQSSSLNHFTTMTISFWTKYYKPTSGANNVSVHISNGLDKGINGEYGYYNYSESSEVKFLLGYWGDSQSISIPFDATRELSAQQFALMTFVVDKEVLKVFLNGNLVDEQTRIFDKISRPSNDWSIGNMEDLYYLNGIIDDLRIYNRALTTEEIHKLYQYGK